MKKILSTILVTALILTSSVPAFAEAIESKGLETAITAAKKVITIPSDYKDFNYQMNSSDQDGKKQLDWNLSWTNTDDTEGIRVTIRDNGYITNYQKFNNNQKVMMDLEPLVKKRQTATAQAFLQK